MNVPKSILVVIGAIFASFTSLALTETVNGITWTYTVSNGRAKVGGGSSSSPAVSTSKVGAITIPTTLGGYRVTGIGEYAFYDCNRLTSVTIPDGVTSIGHRAFYNCSGMSSVMIPNGVTSIGPYVFFGCCSLTCVMIPDSVTSIESSAFYGCSELTSVTIPDSVSSIGDSAFYNCSGLTSVTIPDSVSSIGDSAFYNCSGLTSVTIPDSVASIGSLAFYNCSGITSVTIGKGLTRVGKGAFNGCVGLMSIMVSEKNTEYSSVNSMLLSKDGKTLLKGVNGDVTIPGCVTSIGDSAFSGYGDLTSVTIPDGVTSIGGSAFSGCIGLMSIMVSENNAKYSSVNGLLLSKDGETLLKGVNGDVTIPSCVTRIANSAFSGCSGLTSVTMPDSVTSIGSYAFNGCSGLTSVTMSGGVTSIGDFAFVDCSGLTSVTIPDNVTRIGSSAFSGCSALRDIGVSQVVCSSGLRSIFPSSYQSITNVTISTGVTNIGYAFSNCNGLTNITVAKDNQDYMSKNSLLLSKDGTTLIQGVNGDVVIPDGVTSIGSSAFYGCSGLMSVTIPDSVTSIGYSAFSGCSGLRDVGVSQVVCSSGLRSIFPSSYQSITNVTISVAVTNIDTFAFSGCSELVSIAVLEGNENFSSRNGMLLTKDGTTIVQGINGGVVIPSGVTTIGSHAFYYCSRLTSVTIPDSVTIIGSEAFYNCRGLTSVTIPDSVTSIGSYAFRGCYGLTSVTIGNGVTSIGSRAFSDCSALKNIAVGMTNQDYISKNGLLLSKDGATLIQGVNGNVRIPDGVTSIGNEAFYNCSGLTSVIIPDSVAKIGRDAFYGCSCLRDIGVSQYVCSSGLRSVFPSSYQSISNVTISIVVTNIGNSAFSGCSGLTSVTIPNGVTSIGDSAFDGCSGLSSVTIGSGVMSVGEGAFDGCTNVTEVVVPGWKCGIPFDSVTKLDISDGVTSIGDGAFLGCSGLATIAIPNSVTSIGERAFSKCEGLTSLVIPDSVISIGSSTFYGCSGLMSVTIGSGVMSVGEGAFDGCTNVTEVVVPGWKCGIPFDSVAKLVISDGVTSIGDGAFLGCSGLATIAIPSSVTSIGEQAFSECEGLMSLVIPDGMVSIGSLAFHGCSGLTSVTIPKSVTSIGEGAFDGCTNVTEVVVPGWKCGIPFDSVTKLVISDGVTSIGDGAFLGCSGLASIAIPSSVKSIGNGAFMGCSGLGEITIPFVGSSRGNTGGADALFGYIFGTSSYAGGTSTKQYYSASLYSTFYIPSTLRRVIITDESSFGYGAFSYCSGLTNITFGSSVASIGPAAFRGCSGLTSVAIPKSIASIGNQAFDGCSKLKSLHIDDVAAWCNIKFGNYYSNPLVYANKFYVDDVSVSELAIPNSVRSIGDFAFCKCSGLISVTIPSSVTHIGAYAFRNCTGLTYMRIPNSVTSIDNNAFYSCTKLMSVEMGNSLVSIGESAFEKCIKLTSVVIPNSVTSIGSYAFRDCSGLTNVTIGNRVTSIGSYAFYNCSGLTSVRIPDSVTHIGAYAFSDCSSLTNIVIGSSVTSIGTSAFYGCKGLTHIDIPDSVISIGNGAFGGCSALSYVSVSDNNPVYSSVNGMLLSKDGEVLILGVNGDLVIPNTVTSIEASAFYGRSGLTSVTMSDSVTNIGDRAFYGCSSLASVTIPGSLMNIGEYAFSGTKFYDGLPEGLVIFGRVLYSIKGAGPSVVEIPDGVSCICSRAFYNCSGLTSVAIPSSVTNIGSYALFGCSRLTSITFDGDRPTVGSSAFSNLSSACRIYVRRASSGWRVEIPGKWNGIAIDYVHHDVRLDANGGMCGVVELSIADGSEMGELPVPTKDGAEFYGWFTDRAGGERVTASTVILGATTLYARWLTEVDTPVVSTSGGSVFRQDSCEVTISCATEGAAIYYTDDGATPERNDAYLYAGPITITDTTTFKAIAVYGLLKSDYVTSTITKQGLTIEETLDAGEGVVIATDAAIPWKPFLDSTAKVGDATVRSGAIGDRASTWLSATVEGAGTMSFWCKTSCEHDEDNMFTWDRLMIYTNDVEIAEWRMDGETDWTERTLAFGGGTNTVKWVYYKDRTGAGGEDCAWVDAVAWSPAGAADPIPAVADDADVATVNAAVDEVGFADAAVKEVIGGSAEEYNAFKTWVDGVKGATGDALAGEAAVVANAHAAAAYLLGAERLFENEPTVEIGELAIAEGESAGTTAMTVAVTVKDGESAVAVSVAKVAAMFEATGNLSDWNGAAKLKPTVTPTGTDASGKMTFVVTPGDGTSTKAFLRIKR